MKENIIVLTSKIGNGLYFPSLLIKNKLEKQGCKVELLIFEDFLTKKGEMLFDSIKSKAQLKNKINIEKYYAFCNKLGHSYSKRKINKLINHCLNCKSTNFI